jgi:hypothetical protein
MCLRIVNLLIKDLICLLLENVLSIISYVGVIIIGIIFMVVIIRPILILLGNFLMVLVDVNVLERWNSWQLLNICTTIILQHSRLVPVIKRLLFSIIPKHRRPSSFIIRNMIHCLLKIIQTLL